MQKILIGVGVAAGAASFYVLSLSSAFWTSIQDDSDFVWAALLCAVGFASSTLLAL